MTNEEVTAWRLAAEADGWAVNPTYRNEPVTSAFRATREGYIVQGISRPQFPKVASIHIWGPDGLQIKVPQSYDMEAIKAGLETCAYCKAHPVKTHRVSFAGRCCEACLPEQRKRQEYQGWSN